MISIGIEYKVEHVVKEDELAASMGSGLLPVYATPCMIKLMEETAWKSVEPYMEEGCGTVGTAVNIKHLSATPVGLKVHCESKLVEVDGKRLVFDVKVFDEKCLIGEGTHERFIINNEKFVEKSKLKLN